MKNCLFESIDVVESGFGSLDEGKIATGGIFSEAEIESEEPVEEVIPKTGRTEVVEVETVG